MSFFDLDPTATRNAIDRATLNPLNPEDLKPGWFAGAWKAPVTGLASAVNDAALLLGDAGTPVLRAAVRPVDELFNTKLDDWVTSQQQVAVDNIKEMAPDPRTTGVVGQVVHGLFNVIPEVVAGGPETAAVLQGYKGFRGGMADGLDPGTAFGKGAIDGISTWAGLKIPMTVAPRLGVLGTVATGAGGNVATGMASRGATGLLLEQRGYKDMAEQYKVLDQSAIAVDLLLGGGMGALAHYGPTGLARYQEWRSDKRFAGLVSDVDTALGLNNQLHAELDTAPGIPTNPEARAAHVEALQSSLKSLMDGNEVQVGNEVTTHIYEENPSAARVRQDIVRVVEDYMGPEWVAFDAELKARGLTSEDVDTSQVVRTVRQPVRVERPAIPTLQEFSATHQPDTTKPRPDLALREFEAKQQDLLLSDITKDLNGGTGLTLAALRDLGLANNMKEAMQSGMGRLVKSQAKGGMSVDMLAERLHQAGWIPTEDVESARELVSNVFAKKGQREPVVHSSMADEHARLRHEASTMGEFEAYQSEKAGKKAEHFGLDAELAKSNPEAAHAYMEIFETELARQRMETSGIGKLDNATAQIVGEHPYMDIMMGNEAIASIDALAKADAEIAKAEQDSQGFDAAVSCALRG